VLLLMIGDYFILCKMLVKSLHEDFGEDHGLEPTEIPPTLIRLFSVLLEPIVYYPRIVNWTKQSTP
jgi:hypothetical protein